MVRDTVSGKGPLAGILAGLINSEYRYNLVMACDMPLVNPDLVKYMAALSPGYDIVAPRVGQHVEPLLSVYSRDCIQEIEKLLALDMLKVDNLFGKVRTRFIEPAEIDAFDPGHLSFLNINTPADLEKAEGLLGRN